MRRLTAAFRRRGLSALGWVSAAALTVALVACVDESHELQVQALGGEAPGVSPGPLHRPGQPCLVCHGSLGPSSHSFVIAGTVYEMQGQTAPAPGVQVVLEDSTGASVSLDTNQAGNFYIPTGEWSPLFPLWVPQMTRGQSATAMQTHIARAGSCADCHTLTGGPASAGPVYLNKASAPASPMGSGP